MTVSPKSLENLRPAANVLGSPEDYEGEIEYLNWHGHKIAVYGSARLNAEFFDEIEKRRRDNRAVIIVITGPAGEGKSYAGLRFCEIFDKNFSLIRVDDLDAIHEYFKDNIGRPADPSQVIFDRSDFLFLVGNDSPLDYGQCVLVDEAQYAMGSRRWYEELQKALMEAIESVRSRGYIIVIVALHLELLDKIIRKFVLTYMFHVEERGKAVVYRLYTPRFETEMRRRRIGVLSLQIPSKEECVNSDCLRCNFLYGTNRKEFHGYNPQKHKCSTLRAIYEQRKKHFIGIRSQQAEEQTSSKIEEKQYTNQELIKFLYEHRDELMRSERNNRYIPEYISRFINEKLEIRISRDKSYALRKELELEERLRTKEKMEKQKND